MNRTNIFFDRLDEFGLEEMIQILKRRKPYLAHAHPSTIYPLACYVEKKYGNLKLFEVFESSGELLEPYQREVIAKALKCRVIDRYGLAELGVMAYQLGGEKSSLQVFESEGWVESQKFIQDELTFEELHEIKIEKLNVPSNDVLKALSYGDFRTVLMIFKKVYKNKNDVYPIKIKGPRSFEYFENNRWIPDAYGTHIMECIFKNMEELFLKNNDLDDVGQEIFFRNQLFINKFMTEKYRKSLFKHIIEEVEIHN
jgi:hypothetical protein